MKTATSKLTYSQILEAAMSLRKNDRRRLSQALDETLEPKSVDDMNDAELEAELNRRHEEALRDPSVMIPLDIAMEHLWKLAREGA